MNPENNLEKNRSDLIDEVDKLTKKLPKDKQKEATPSDTVEGVLDMGATADQKIETQEPEPGEILDVKKFLQLMGLPESADAQTVEKRLKNIGRDKNIDSQKKARFEQVLPLYRRVFGEPSKTTSKTKRIEMVREMLGESRVSPEPESPASISSFETSKKRKPAGFSESEQKLVDFFSKEENFIDDRMRQAPVPASEEKPDADSKAKQESPAQPAIKRGKKIDVGEYVKFKDLLDRKKAEKGQKEYEASREEYANNIEGYYKLLKLSSNANRQDVEDAFTRGVAELELGAADGLVAPYESQERKEELQKARKALREITPKSTPKIEKDKQRNDVVDESSKEKTQRESVEPERLGGEEVEKLKSKHDHIIDLMQHQFSHYKKVLESAVLSGEEERIRKYFIETVSGMAADCEKQKLALENELKTQSLPEQIKKLNEKIQFYSNFYYNEFSEMRKEINGLLGEKKAQEEDFGDSLIPVMEAEEAEKLATYHAVADKYAGAHKDLIGSFKAPEGQEANLEQLQKRLEALQRAKTKEALGTNEDVERFEANQEQTYQKLVGQYERIKANIEAQKQLEKTEANEPVRKNLKEHLEKLKEEGEEKELKRIIKGLAGERTYRFINGKRQYLSVEINPGTLVANLVVYNEDGTEKIRKENYDKFEKITYLEWKKIKKEPGEEELFRADNGNYARVKVEKTKKGYSLKSLVDDKLSGSVPTEKMRAYEDGENIAYAKACEGRKVAKRSHWPEIEIVDSPAGHATEKEPGRKKKDLSQEEWVERFGKTFKESLTENLKIKEAEKAAREAELKRRREDAKEVDRLLRKIKGPGEPAEPTDLSVLELPESPGVDSERGRVKRFFAPTPQEAKAQDAGAGFVGKVEGFSNYIYKKTVGRESVQNAYNWVNEKLNKSVDISYVFKPVRYISDSFFSKVVDKRPYTTLSLGTGLAVGSVFAGMPLVGIGVGGYLGIRSMLKEYGRQSTNEPNSTIESMPHLEPLPEVEDDYDLKPGEVSGGTERGTENTKIPKELEKSEQTLDLNFFHGGFSKSIVDKVAEDMGLKVKIRKKTWGGKEVEVTFNGTKDDAKEFTERAKKFEKVIIKTVLKKEGEPGVEKPKEEKKSPSKLGTEEK